MRSSRMVRTALVPAATVLLLLATLLNPAGASAANGCAYGVRYDYSFPKAYLQRKFADGSDACVTVWKHNSDGTYSKVERACNNIHS